MRVRWHMYGIFIIIAVLLCLPALASDPQRKSGDRLTMTNGLGQPAQLDSAGEPILPRPTVGQPVTYAPRDPSQSWWPYAERISDHRFTAPRVEEMDESLINVNGVVLLDTKNEGLALNAAPADLILPEGEQLTWTDGFYLVKIAGRDRTEAQIEELGQAGAVLGEYINLNTYIVKIPAEKVGAVKALPFVTYVGDYHPLYKINPGIGTLKVPAEIMYEPNWRFEVTIHKGVDMKSVIDNLAAKGIFVKDEDIVVNDYVQAVFFEMEPKGIVEIAKMPEVKWISEAGYPRLMATSSSPTAIPMLLQNNGTFTTSTATGWKLWNAGIDGNASGTKQIVTMMDTGLNTKQYHFSENTATHGTIGASHRKVRGYDNYGGDLCVLSYTGADGGHGTWTSQHAVGSISNMSSNPDTTHTPNTYYDLGVAKDAMVYFQDIGTSSGTLNVPATLTASMTAAQTNGSYVQNHSWGGATTYSSYVSTLDGDLNSATYENLVVTVSAGNDPGQNTVFDPATAKNVITVGGVDAASPNSVFTDTDWGLGSSQGPVATSNRTKPDICGYMAASATVGGENMAGNRPSAMCQADATKTPYWDWTNLSNYGGTSFSAPQVAGLAALIRDYFLAGFYPSGTAGGTAVTPSATLVKAILLASGENTTGFNPDTPNTFTYRYSNCTGYGRVNLPSVLRIGGSAPYLWVKNNITGATSTNYDYTYSIKGNNMPLRIMLVWDDPAGNALQRNLNLTATIGSTTYYGNNFSTTGWTNTGTTVDATNNTEGIFLSTATLPSSGNVTVRVALPSSGSQTFSLVVSGNVYDDATQVSLDKSRYDCADPVVTTVVDSNESTARSVTLVSRNASAVQIDSETVSCTGTAPFFTNTIQTAGTNSAGVLYVVHGGSITATYNDTNPTGTYTATATVNCQALADDGGFIIDGGCDNYFAAFDDPVAGPLYNSNSNEYYNSYMDAGEYSTYTFGFVNRTGYDLTDARVALSFTGTRASNMTVYNSPVLVGAVPNDTLAGAAFQVFTAAGTAYGDVNMNFALTSPADGLTEPLTITQVQYLQANDTITRQEYCQTFTGSIGSYFDTALTGTQLNPWQYTNYTAENRTDGSCDSATIGAACAGVASATTSNFAASAFSWLGRNVQPALTGNAGNGRPYYYALKWHSFYGAQETSGNTQGVWGVFYHPAWNSAINPIGDDFDGEFPWQLAYYYHTAISYDYTVPAGATWDWETANSGTPDDPDAGPPNQWYVTLPDTPYQATSGSYFSWGQAHADLYWFTGTATTTRRDIGTDNDRLVYDQLYTSSQATASCSTTQVGQVSLDKFTYYGCPDDVISVSVLDSNASSPVSVTIVSLQTGDSETVSCTGTAPYFVGSLDISTDGTGRGVNNGMLYIGIGDTLTATYTDANPSGSTVAYAGTSCAGGDVVYTSNTQILDNGDNDGFADNNETVTVDITITNNMSTDLTNAVVYLFSSDSDIYCITDNQAAYGTVTAGAPATNPTSDRFQFQVNPATDCTNWQAPPTASFDVVITGDDFYGSASPQGYSINLDLDTYSGSGYTYTQDFSTDPGWAVSVTPDDDGTCTGYVNSFAYRPDGHAAGNGCYGAWAGTGGTIGATGTTTGLTTYDSSTVTSPTWTVAGNVTLNQQVAYRTSATYTGCKVQYSRNGGAWTNLNFTTPAQAAITTNATYCYPGDNSPADSVWWSAAGQNWTTTSTSTVTATAGDTIAFRWRIGIDSTGGASLPYAGFGIDNLTITNLQQTVQCEPTTNSGLPNNCFVCSGAPGAPVITGITNVSACLLDGIQVAYTAGSSAKRHDLYRDGSLAVTSYTSGATYVPGDYASHNYVVRAVCDAYYTDSNTMAGTDTGCPTLVYSTHGTPTQITGDGDAYYELGEKWSVSVTLQNTGAIPATNVYATLAGNGIQVCTPSMSYGTIAAGATASATYEFVISTSFTPCGGTIGFDVTTKTCTETCSGCADELDVFTLTVGQLTGGTSNRFGPDDAPYASGLWTFGGAAAGSAAHCSPSSNAYVNLTRDQYMTLTTGVSTVGYTNIHVYFDRAFNACETGDVFTMDYSTNGSTWTNAWTQNFDDNAWHCANDITLPAGAQGVATLYIRFYCNANVNDYGWIDNVRITGDNYAYDCTYVGSGTCSTCTPPGAPTITAVNDVDACAQSGVQVVYTAGSGATTHDLYVDTVKVVDDYASGATYNPGNTTSHNYVVRAINTDDSCYTDSTLMAGTDANNTPGAPTITAVNDVDACAQSGVQVVYTAGSGATSHNLYDNGSLAVTGYASGATYNPGNTASHTYIVRAINGTCYTNSASMAGTDANNTPGAPTITAVNDVDACAQSGVQVVYTAGSGATSHNLYDNGSLAVTGYASGATYNPGNTASHTYIVRAINGTCYTNSTSMAGTDANNTPGAPTITAVNDVDACAQSGVQVVYTAGSGATSHNLYDNGALAVTGYASGATYNPGNTASHTYIVRAISGTCYANSTSMAGTDANNTPGAPTITAVNDVDACAQSGVQVVYTAGSGATSHNLYDNGSLAVTGYASGATYNPGNTASHTYIVRAINGTCYTNSASMAGTDANNTPGAPTITAVNDVDACAQNGVQVVYTAGSGATSHNLYDNGSLAVTGYASGATYNPGDTASHTYIVRAINGTCYTNSASMAGTDVNNSPGAPTITAVNDVDACAQSGVQVVYTAGSGATSHNLYDNGSLAVTGYASGATYNPGDTASHTYIVRAISGTCFTNSASMAGTDANGSVAAITLTATDPDGATTCGITLTWTGGTGATQFNLWVDGSPGPTNITSGYVYTPGDVASHSYVVRGVNGTCFTDSNAQAVADPGCGGVCVAPTGEVTETVITDKSGFNWTATDATGGYRVSRGLQANLAALNSTSTDFSCYATTASTVYTISISGDDPSGVTGRCYYYLIQGYNGSDANTCVGPAGNSTAGARSVELAVACP